jgi:inner membrane protein
MDSLTQITLGAAIGEAVGGEKAKNRAPLWGGLAGLLPDLDVLFGSLYSRSEYLIFHRGISHSILFVLVASPVLAWIASRLHPSLSFRRWFLLVFLALLTHPILDIMTIYGTGFLEPFSGVRLAIGNINIVDPVYTLPMLAALLLLPFFRNRKVMHRIVIGAFIFSNIYLGLSLVNHQYMAGKFRDNLREQNIEYTRMMVSPTFLNNILWYGVAVDNERAWLGLYSHLDREKKIRFMEVPRNLQLERKIPPHDLANLTRFSKGFYTLSEQDGILLFHDLRFGFIRPGTYVFNFDFSDESKSPFGGSIGGESLGPFFRRILGE